MLDLRDGWGGANPSYLNLFNRKVPVMSSKDRNGDSRGVDDPWRRPVVLLVNEDTRSGKEVLAFGRLWVDGENLEGVGVTPDVIVPFDRCYAAGADPQLDRAVEVAVQAARSGKNGD